MEAVVKRTDPRGPIRRRAHQRGSALLIVFVLAAIIAIALYREMPVVAFEARRHKEETLVARGHEYQRAVQLYYRKFQGRYPANIDMLENTNNLRFLRRRYTDPFTGKDDWRLLHAGPGGQLIDSKVQNFNPNGVFGPNGTNAGNSGLAAGSGGGARNGFGRETATPSDPNSGAASPSGPGAFGESASTSSDSDVTVAPVAKRAPVVAANAPGGTPTSGDLNQDPSIPLLPPQDPAADSQTNPPANAPGAPGNAAAGSNQQNTGPNAMQTVQNLFASGANQPQGQTAAAGLNGGGAASTIGSTGNIAGGAFAGVASKAKGRTIKKINEQTDYSLWEFWYDPTKDTSLSGSPQNGPAGPPLNTGAPGMNTATPQNPAAATATSPDSTGPANPPAAPPPAAPPQ